jgi:hypothetical protein
MPKPDGWDLLNALKPDPDLCDIPVIIVTAAPERGIVHSLWRGWKSSRSARRRPRRLRWPSDGIASNEHYTGDGAIIYKHACALGCDGIVSKCSGSPYRPGRAEVKNPAAPDPVAMRCLRCRHGGSLSRAEFARFGLKLDAPIAAFVKRLRCSKCGSASVMARRVSRELVVHPPRQRRRA